MFCIWISFFNLKLHFLWISKKKNNFGQQHFFFELLKLCLFCSYYKFLDLPVEIYFDFVQIIMSVHFSMVRYSNIVLIISFSSAAFVSCGVTLFQSLSLRCFAFNMEKLLGFLNAAVIQTFFIRIISQKKCFGCVRIYSVYVIERDTFIFQIARFFLWMFWPILTLVIRRLHMRVISTSVLHISDILMYFINF